MIAVIIDRIRSVVIRTIQRIIDGVSCKSGYRIMIETAVKTASAMESRRAPNSVPICSFLAKKPSRTSLIPHSVYRIKKGRLKGCIKRSAPDSKIRLTVRIFGIWVLIILFSSPLDMVRNRQQQAVWSNFIKDADDFHLHAGNNHQFAAQGLFDSIFCYIFA